MAIKKSKNFFQTIRTRLKSTTTPAMSCPQYIKIFFYLSWNFLFSISFDPSGLFKYSFTAYTDTAKTGCTSGWLYPIPLGKEIFL
jgi:hypothetical protein